MKKSFIFIAMFACTIVASLAQTANDCSSEYTELLGIWENQYKSTLNIISVDTKTGQISGIYKTGVGAPKDEYTLIGWLNCKKIANVDGHNVIAMSFSVSWAEHGSITSWVGFYSKQDGKLKVLWHLVRPNTKYEYEHILSGHDIFSKK